MKTLAKLILLAGFAISRPVLAICIQMSQDQVDSENKKGYPSARFWHFNMTFAGSTSIDPTLPIGSVIAEATTPPFTAEYTNFAACLNGGTVGFDPTGTPTSITNVQKTNVAGIGYRVSYVRARGPSALPFQTTLPPGPPGQIIWARFPAGTFFKIELIKTGDILGSVNKVTLGTVGYGSSLGDAIKVVQLSASATEVKVLPHCSVKSNPQNIEFGSFGPSDVSTLSGPTQSVEFTVNCTGPTMPDAITASLNGTSDPEDRSLLKNTGATHLAIRLRDPSTGTILKPDDPNSTLSQKPDAQKAAPFKLDATVLRVGAATPTAGRIQATATITMTLR